MASSVEFQPFSPAFVADPYPVYHRLRAAEPVHWSEQLGAWVFTRYADAVSLLSDTRFSSAARYIRLFDDLPLPVQERVGRLRQLTAKRLGMTDPPEHTRLRRLLGQAFAPNVMERLRPRIQWITDQLVDAVQPLGEMDAIRDVAFPLPALVMMDALGVPFEDWGRVQGWVRDQVVFFASGDSSPEPAALALRAHAGAVAFEQYLEDIICWRRASRRGDLLGAFLDLRDERGPLTRTELIATGQNMITAGHEPVSHMIGTGLLALLRYPAASRGLADDPVQMAAVVEELLRYGSPAQFVARTAVQDVEIGGRRIARGDACRIALGAVNRDPEQFADPDRFDPTRFPNRHAAFALGIHYCLGARLARLEAEVVFGTLLRRLPGLRLATESVEYRPGIGLRALVALPVRWNVAASA